MIAENKIKAPFYQKFALVLIGLSLLVYLVILGKDILSPLVFGFLFAILLLPIANFFENKLRFPRSMAAITSLLVLLGLIAGVLYLVGSQISNLADDWPMLKSQVQQSIKELSQYIRHAFHISQRKQMGYVEDTEKKILASGTGFLGETFGAISSVLVFYIFSLIFCFFTLLYRHILLKFLVWAFHEGHTHIVHDIVENVQRILRQYILGLLLEMIVVATLACTAFFLIGVKYAVLLGILIGLFNLIPYLGIFSALLLSCLITFATGSINNTAMVAACVLGIHLIDSNFLLPTIVGSKVKLNAFVTFLGLLLGETIWGLSGMFLSIPIMAILKIIFDRVEDLKPWGYLLGTGKEIKIKKVKLLLSEEDE